MPVLESFPIATVLLAPDGRVARVSSRYTELTGYRLEDLLTDPPELALPPSVGWFAVDSWSDLPGTGPVRSDWTTDPLARRDGRILVVRWSWSRFELDGQPWLLIFLQDAAENGEELGRLRWAIARDGLTGLLTRDAMTQRMDQAVLAGARLEVAMIDVDNLKLMNDSHGHQAGDLVLATVARVLSECVPADGAVARWGGDEFVVAIRENPGEPRLLSLVSQALGIAVEIAPGVHEQLSVSIGVSRCDQHHPPAGALAAADAQMYHVKALRPRRRGAAVVPDATGPLTQPTAAATHP